MAPLFKTFATMALLASSVLAAEDHPELHYDSPPNMLIDYVNSDISKWTHTSCISLFGTIQTFLNDQSQRTTVSSPGGIVGRQTYLETQVSSAVWDTNRSEKTLKCRKFGRLDENFFNANANGVWCNGTEGSAGLQVQPWTQNTPLRGDGCYKQTAWNPLKNINWGQMQDRCTCENKPLNPPPPGKSS